MASLPVRGGFLQGCLGEPRTEPSAASRIRPHRGRGFPSNQPLAGERQDPRVTWTTAEDAGGPPLPGFKDRGWGRGSLPDGLGGQDLCHFQEHTCVHRAGQGGGSGWMAQQEAAGVPRAELPTEHRRRLSSPVGLKNQAPLGSPLQGFLSPALCFVLFCF